MIIDKPRKKSGRPSRDARSIFNSLIWLARTGSQWSQLPRRYSPVSTAHERFSAWVEGGCLRRVWAVILEEYGEELGIDWDGKPHTGGLLIAPLGKGASGAEGATGSNPIDYGKAGCKPTLLMDAKGIPLAVMLCRANRHDS
ncbi:transposase (plasmid) [Deinococcus psychrotolerans]|uniref:Transposase n=1 Tax=Deinococcus psychrotolerans TaxID=2489213 RepID=A0A3G8YJK9_9DEIO|nr:transposase [Deinococcus psychrotolerans]